MRNFNRNLLVVVAALMSTAAFATEQVINAPKPDNAQCADFTAFMAVVDFGVSQAPFGYGLVFSTLDPAKTLLNTPHEGLRVPSDGLSVKPPAPAQEAWVLLQGGSGAEPIRFELHDQRSVASAVIVADPTNSIALPTGGFALTVGFTDTHVDNFVIFSNNNELGVKQICFAAAEE